MTTSPVDTSRQCKRSPYKIRCTWQGPLASAPVQDDNGGGLYEAVGEHVLEHAGRRHHRAAALRQHQRHRANVRQLRAHRETLSAHELEYR